MSAPDLLAVRGLTVRYRGAAEPALSGLDLTVGAGECVAVVGPSGCGKSTLCRALLDLLPPGAERTGAVAWRGRDLTGDPTAWRGLRGRDIGLVLQDHRHALDPVRTIGDQVAEVAALDDTVRHRDGPWAVALGALERVHLGPAPVFARRYPHELSGGQRQRANLAAALCRRPALLLADEPTTALDLPVQRDIMALLASLVRDDGLAMVLVTHDRALVPLVADRVVALGEPLDTGAAIRSRSSRVAGESRLEVRGLVVAAGGRDVVRGVSLDVPAGRSVGVVGESGAGKTTLVRGIAGWITPRAGLVAFRGDVPADEAGRRRAVQLVSQDPAAALDPQQTILAAVSEADRQAQGGRADSARVRDLIAAVDLTLDEAARRPFQLSGGQRQRAQIARALAADPLVLLADEPASSLDPERRRGLLDLLDRASVERGLGLLLVSHDLDLVTSRCDEVVVMVDGLVVERYAPRVHGEPLHPHARALLAAAPSRLSRGAMAAVSGPRTAATTDRGCPHADRCPEAEDACRSVLPPLVELPDGRWLRCPPHAPGRR